MARMRIFVVVLDKLRLGSLGHIIRMEDECNPKKLHNGKFHNIKQVGKMRTRWKDVVRRDILQILRIRGWWREAEDREEWKRLLR